MGRKLPPIATRAEPAWAPRDRAHSAPHDWCRAVWTVHRPQPHPHPNPNPNPNPNHRLYQARKEQAEATVAHDAEPIWRGTVVKSMPGMLNGEVMLRGAKVGDRIEVLAEETGPGGVYLTARNPTTGQVGFYPVGWVRHPERGVPAQGPVAC